MVCMKKVMVTTFAVIYSLLALTSIFMTYAFFYNDGLWNGISTQIGKITHLQVSSDENTVVLNTRIKSFQPAAGTPGTVISIEGKDFGQEQKSSSIQLDGQPVPVKYWDNGYIEVIIPKDARSGDLSVSIGGRQYMVGSFILQQVERKPLLSKDLQDFSNQQEISYKDQLKVSIPKGFSDSTQRLEIKEVKNLPGLNTGLLKGSTVYGITIGNMEKFDIPIKLDFKYEPSGETGDEAVQVCYWDEDALSWVAVPTSLDREKKIASVITNHLTDYVVMYYMPLSKSIVSRDSHFDIYYYESDTYKYEDGTKEPDMKTFATHIGDYLEDAYKKYEAYVGNENTPDFIERYVSDPILGKNKVNSREKIFLKTSQNNRGGDYDPNLKCILIPTIYPDVESAKITVDHELFHAFQNFKLYNTVMNEYRWLMDATAEYASYYIANGKTITKLHQYTAPTKAYYHMDNRANGQEYGMSSFFTYLEGKGVKFQDLWIEILKQNKTIQETLDGYLFQQTGKSTAINYRYFWQDVLTNSARPLYDDVTLGMKSIFYDPKIKTYSYELKIAEDSSYDIVCFKKVKSASKKAFTIQVAGTIPKGIDISVIKVDNYDGKLHTERVSGGISPKGVLFSGSDSSSVTVEFEPNSNSMLYIMAYGAKAGENVYIHINEAELTAVPDMINDGEVNKTVKVDVKSSGLPTSVSKVKFKWTIDDGEDYTFAYNEAPITNRETSQTISHEFKKPGKYTLKVQLFDITNISSSLLGEISVPVTILGEKAKIVLPIPIIMADINANVPLQAIVTNVPKEPVVYKWNFDDGTPELITDTYSCEHTFTAAKSCMVTVKLCLKSSPDKVLSEDKCRVDVQKENKLDLPKAGKATDPFDSGMSIENGPVKVDTEYRAIYYKNSNNYKQGLYQDFYDDAKTKLMNQGCYINNEKAGRWLMYYEDGSVSGEEHYVNNKTNGIYRQWSRDGNLQLEEEYKEGVLDGYSRYFTEKGTIQKEGPRKNSLAEGHWKFYDSNGNLEREGEMSQNMKTGVWKLYKPNGIVTAEVTYVKDVLEGKATEYYDTGEKKSEGQYGNGGQTTGTWTYYKLDGTVEKTVTY